MLIARIGIDQNAKIMEMMNFPLACCHFIDQKSTVASGRYGFP